MGGYVYKNGKLDQIDGEHSETIGHVKDAVNSGIVRIRDHGNIVAFQGRSKSLVKAAIKTFSETIRMPRKITAEWPGTFIEY